MADQTQLPIAGKKKKELKVPTIPNGDDLYNRLMGEIEPDLILPEQEREAKYAGESDTEKASRLKRYSDAIATYKVKYEEYQVQQTGNIRMFGKGLLDGFEEDDKKEDTQSLNSLEAQIANF